MFKPHPPMGSKIDPPFDRNAPLNSCHAPAPKGRNKESSTGEIMSLSAHRAARRIGIQVHIGPPMKNEYRSFQCRSFPYKELP